MSAQPKDLRAASARRYLRGNLPAIYSDHGGDEQPPVMDMLEELERVLDPIVILLDNLAGHLEPATAPAEMIDLLLEMTGTPLDRTLPPPARRGLAGEAARARGTKAGLQLALERAFPDLESEVLDNGKATWAHRTVAQASAPEPGPPAERPAQSTEQAAFQVRLAQAPTDAQLAQLTRCIADHLPLGATYELAVAGG
jgi:phage tail-like protein